MTNRNILFTTIRTEGALLPADLLQRISEGTNLDGLTPESYHRPGEKLNEAINRSWNALQGVWTSFKAAQERLPENDLGTTLTRERWLLPLFRELDYGRLQTAPAVEIDGRSYPISHRWEHVPLHLVSYKLDLDKRTPGATGAASASPHSLLQVFLNRSDDNLWGFLSNGYKLRILRDNASLTRQAYVEFDLEAMMEGEVYSDFVLLWLLCHQSRVEGDKPSDCWLEKWMKVAEDQGTRALDDLRNGVEAAITALGLGFLEHPANAALRDRLQSTDANQLSQQDYYRQLLRMVYRLLFLFVAEDRDLLLNPSADEAARQRYTLYYSTQRLRRMAENFKGTNHPDLFESLRLIMRLLSGESAPSLKSYSPPPDANAEGLGVGADSPARLGVGANRLEAATESIREMATKAMRDIARELRQQQTPAEQILWEALRKNRLGGLGFRRQHPIANTTYVVDFFCYSANLIIELDGEIHQYQQTADAQRQSDLESLGYRLLRFPNERIYTDLETVLTEILTTASYSPPPEGEGLGVGANSPARLGLGVGANSPARLGANLQMRAAAGLGLIPLGSFLFSDKAVPDVIACQIANHHLLDAVRALSLTYDQRAQVYRSVDYRNLGPEELGSIYESLLELHPQINVPARRFALATAGGNERKTTGSYYTPTSLINALLDSALDPVLEAAIKGTHTAPKSDSPPPEGEGLGVGAYSPEGLGVRVTSPEQRILALKICDPACGSGHFLIAAAHRMAKALAFVRTGEEEPPPAAIQEAKRDIISHCIYGVDINPMAVELCKVNLWMEALEPGKPLNFLDHRIQVGNSLLGTTPALMNNGIPDDAFNPIEGDDPKTAAAYKKQNKKEREQRQAKVRQLDLFSAAPPANYRALTDATRWLDRAPDETLDQIRIKEQMYHQLANDPEYIKARLLADAWCAAFVWEKSAPRQESQTDDSSPLSGTGRGFRGEGIPPMTDLLYRRMEADPLADDLQSLRAYVVALKERYQFFHWHIAFPDVFTIPDSLPQSEKSPHLRGGDLEGGLGAVTGWHGGFDCVLGNPPWERIKIQEKEWFAQRNPDIANAPNAAARKRMIESLKADDPDLYADFQNDLRAAEGESHFVRVSGHYPLCGRGDVNTYPLFAESSRHVINGYGRVGMIVPSGIATDDTTKFFFQDLMQTRSLISLFDFENRENIFQGVGHGRYKFCLLTMSGATSVNPESAEFVFYALRDSDLHNPEKKFTLSANEIKLLNPNTHTAAIFRSKRDALITKFIYTTVPILIKDEPNQNHWNIRFATMFHMSGDSHLFYELAELRKKNLEQDGNHFWGKADLYLPLYEAKMIHHFTHRYGDYRDYPENALTSHLPDVSPTKLADPSYMVFPRYWVNALEVRAKLDTFNREWLLGFRNIARSTDERTAIVSVFPLSAVGHSMPIIYCIEPNVACLIANLSVFIFDYVVRQKLGGTNMTFGYFSQFPAIPPHTYTPALLDFIVPRVLELTYTAWDLQPFAHDVGYDGPPFIWDEERRFLMRCELDALYFHLYQIPRDDVDYIMETFPIVKRKDIAATASPPRPEGEGDLGGEGFYRTKHTILDMYDQMSALPFMSVPAPKDESATYPIPDVSQWATWLNPPPADPSVAHRDNG